MKSTQQHKVILGLPVVSLMALILFPEQAHAAAAGGGGLPWEQPLQLISQSIQGPVAYAISLLAIIGCGGTLVWGGEINDFLRRGILLVLVISLIVFAAQVLTGVFNSGAGV